MNNTINENLLRQIFFILLLLFLGIVLFNQMWFFFSSFLGAVTFYVLMRKRMFYLTEVRKWKPAGAAWVLMVLSFFIILVPLGLLGNIMYSKISYVVAHSGEMLNSLKTFAENLKTKLGYQVIDPNSINRLGPFLAELLPKLLSITGNSLLQIVGLYFFLFFMLVRGRHMEDVLYEYIPLKDSNVDLLAEEVNKMVIANTIGIPLIAFIQGIVALIGYLIIGIPEPWLWFVATCIAGMLPILGAASIYIPLIIMQFVAGHSGKGIGLAVWSFGITGLVDNVFRLYINRRLGDIHPLITFFGVLIGVQLFGFIGLIFGPLLISMFILLLRIYGNEFLIKKREHKEEI